MEIPACRIAGMIKLIVKFYHGGINSQAEMIKLRGLLFRAAQFLLFLILILYVAIFIGGLFLRPYFNGW